MNNSGPVVDMLDALALLLAMKADGGSAESAQTLLKRDKDGSGCLHINLELRTHTFLETVALMRRVSMIVSMQGSQLFNALFADRGTRLIEILPADHPGGKYRAESNRIFYSSLGMRTAILPIYGKTKFGEAPLSVDVCRLVRLIHQLVDLTDLVCGLKLCVVY